MVAIVTGGASGISAATVAQLAQRGAAVAVLDRSVASILDAAIASVVTNNAGIGATGDISASDQEEWHLVFDVNVGLAGVTRAALRHRRHSPRVAIVNTCSLVAVVEGSRGLLRDHVPRLAWCGLR